MKNFNEFLLKVFVSVGITILFSIGVQAQATLASWNFSGKGGQSSVATATVVSGVSTTWPSAVASLGAGLTAINYLNNGLTSRAQTQTTLANAITGNDYISFTITPASGKSVTITSVKLRPVSQNVSRSFSLFSSKNGFSASNVIGTFSAQANQFAALQTINVSGHTTITTATEFRVYIYGATDQWQSCGIGNRQISLSETDLSIEGTVQDAGPPPNLTINVTDLNFTAAAGNQNINVTSNIGWTVSANQSWIHLNVTSGNINGVVNVAVDSNPSQNSRPGTITFTGGSITRLVNVSQAGAPQQPTSILYEAEGSPNNNPVIVTRTGGGIASDHPPYSGSGFWAYVHTQGNKIVFTNVPATVTNVNLTCRYANGMGSVRTMSLYVNGTKEQINFPVTANWHTWADRIIPITLPVGNSNTIEFRYDAGDNGNINIDYIAVSGGTLSNTLTVNPSSLSFTSPGGSQPVTITSNISWTATTNNSWITLTSTGGSVSVQVSANTGPAARNGSVTISGGGIERIVSVAQSGIPSSTMAIGSNFWNKEWSPDADYFQLGVNWATVTNPWSSQFINDLELANYKVIRFMDWVPTNSSKKKNWSDRVLKTANQYESDGVAYEWQIDLCNRIGADLWITVPHLTIESYESNNSDNYWTRLADLILSQLDPDLNVWVEYSNESWSGGASFNQGDYLAARGTQMGFDADGYTAKFFFHVYAATRLHKVFLDKFSGQTNRIKTVIAGQSESGFNGDKNWGTHVQLMALKNKLINGTTNTIFNPHNAQPEYYTIANYVSANNGAASDLRSQWTASIALARQRAQNVLNTFSFNSYPPMKLVAYEGGSHITNNAHTFSNNPQSYDMYKEWLDGMEDYYELSCHYTHLGAWNSGGAWGAKKSTAQPLSEAHKFRAIVDWVNDQGGNQRVRSSSMEIEMEADEKMSVYPNPINGDVLNVTIFADRKSEARISIRSSTNQKTIDLQRTLEKGNNTIQIPTTHLRNGLHLLIINKGYERILKKVVIDR